VRIRLVDLSAMSHHPIHLHGYQFKVTETDGGQIPESAQQVETTVLTAVGQTRTFEFIADEPGDWAMHCHMNHHVMNQMGDEFPVMIGVDPTGLDEKIQKLMLPGYMTMGQDGMGDMGKHIQHKMMPAPRNSIPMVGGEGPFDYITMGGLFTILKVREGITTDDDPGWYQHPPGTVATIASPDELSRDGIEVPAPGKVASYACPMHPGVVSPKPAKCPKCGMNLTPKKSSLPSARSGGGHHH
jgi:manganese oxidase